MQCHVRQRGVHHAIDYRLRADGNPGGDVVIGVEVHGDATTFAQADAVLPQADSSPTRSNTLGRRSKANARIS